VMSLSGLARTAGLAIKPGRVGYTVPNSGSRSGCQVQRHVRSSRAAVAFVGACTTGLCAPRHRGAFRFGISSLRSCSSSMDSAPSGLSDAERFFFDLNGFITVKGLLSPAEVKACNNAIDVHAAEIRSREDETLRNTKEGTPLRGDGTTPRKELGCMLSWPEPHCTPFRHLLAHPRIVPYLNDLCGSGFRMDHLPLLIVQKKGGEGFHLHGGPLHDDGRFNPTLQYRCEKGEFYNSLLAMSVQLVDHNEGDGGFCVARGSHKMNFPMPDAFRHGQDFQEHLYQPTTKAGDVVFFSEATVHGALPWVGEHERRIVIYRFAPSTVAYSRSYAPQWPKQMYEGTLTPAQQAVMQPPYANRLDRPALEPGKEEPVVTSRAQPKKEFDKVVFGNDYF